MPGLVLLNLKITGVRICVDRAPYSVSRITERQGISKGSKEIQVEMLPRQSSLGDFCTYMYI